MTTRTTLFTTETCSKYLRYTNGYCKKEVRKDRGMGGFTVLNIIRIDITVTQNVCDDSPKFLLICGAWSTLNETETWRCSRISFTGIFF